MTEDYCKDEIPTENKTNTPFPFRSNQTIERKKAEACAERELAARKREDARRAKDEVKYDNYHDERIKISMISGKHQAERRGEHG